MAQLVFCFYIISHLRVMHLCCFLSKKKQDICFRKSCVDLNFISLILVRGPSMPKYGLVVLSAIAVIHFESLIST